MADPDNQRSRPQTTIVTSTTIHAPITTTTTSTAISGRPQTVVHTTTSGPQATTVWHPTITTTQFPLPRPRLPAPVASAASQPLQQPSIRIRRQGTNDPLQINGHDDRSESRPVGSAEPQRDQPPQQPQDEMKLWRQATAQPLQTLHEEGFNSVGPDSLPPPATQPQRGPSTRRPGPQRQTSAISLRSNFRGTPGPHEYGADIVGMLDVIDPEVATLTTLNNVQNSLFIPNLGHFYRRQPTYNLSQSPSSPQDEDIGVALSEPVDNVEREGADGEKIRPPGPARLDTSRTISSVLSGMSEGHNYAVLPHGASLPGWTAEEKAALNDHVRHLLHSRRAKFKRGLRGFGLYIRKPVGFLVTLWAFLLTFWGAAWVLFLIGWISVGGRQDYFIEICDQILTALFCVVGIGFAPWRAVDTYHMIFVAHYAHLTWRHRRQRGLPDLKDRNELPQRSPTHAWEAGEESVLGELTEESVLTAAQQAALEHHQSKLAASHTFYKPRETVTHRAFSIRLLIAIVVLLDCHSLFQMALGATTWGIYYKHRPHALTAVILSCSISCNISAGITITMGDRRSRKKLVVEQMFRQGLTEEALATLHKERGLKAKGVNLGYKRKKKMPEK